MSMLRPPLLSPLYLPHRFFARFRSSTEANFSFGNRVLLLSTGADFFSDLFAALAAAKTSISLEFYIIRADRTGSRLAVLLQEAVQRGVRVDLLYDYVGCFETPSSYFAALKANGIRCAVFNPLSLRKGLHWFDRRDHRKLAVIDSCLAYVGGLNVGDEYAGVDPECCWRDLGIRLEGPAALELQSLFAENWQEATDAAAAAPITASAPDFDNAAVAIVSGGPHHASSRIRAAFMLGMAGARENIRIQTPYFVPGVLIIRGMLRAVRRGVDVEVILPSRSDVPLLRLVNRSYYNVLLKGGVKVYERQGTILHSKVMLADSAWAMVGSANLDQRSFHRNYEVNVVVANAEFGRQIAAVFAAERKCSRLMLIDEHERRSWLVRFLEWLLMPIAWFL